MFKIIPNPTFPVSVSITRPGEETPALLKLTCRHKTKTQLAAFLAVMPTGQTAVDDADYLGQVVESWGDEVQGADGQPLPFTPDNFAALLDNFPAARLEIFGAYMRTIAESRVKN